MPYVLDPFSRSERGRQKFRARRLVEDASVLANELLVDVDRQRPQTTTAKEIIEELGASDRFTLEQLRFLWVERQLISEALVAADDFSFDLGTRSSVEKMLQNPAGPLRGPLFPIRTESALDPSNEVQLSGHTNGWTFLDACRSIRKSCGRYATMVAYMGEQDHDRTDQDEVAGTLLHFATEFGSLLEKDVVTRDELAWVLADHVGAKAKLHERAPQVFAALNESADFATPVSRALERPELPTKIPGYPALGT